MGHVTKTTKHAESVQENAGHISSQPHLQPATSSTCHTSSQPHSSQPHIQPATHPACQIAN
ncbi:hypothetical protein JIN82_15850 [Persicirhabdus sediminis]|uniref:Uncharacterized protein n=2 Tax=Persicirhabdus sediminis TaxID=454144 RepID=A0A8J7MET7_9BACT|nr:hypothetical protein [Persicirhabdus sediminis]